MVSPELTEFDGCFVGANKAYLRQILAECPNLSSVQACRGWVAMPADECQDPGTGTVGIPWSEEKQ